MSDSSTLLDLISESQAGKATAANDLLDAASPAMLYGRRASTTGGLTWGYFGGRLSSTLIANGTVLLTASTTNYIVAARSNGAVTVASTTTNWDNLGAYMRLYKVVTGSASVTSYEDHRSAVPGSGTVTGSTVNVFTKNQSVTPVVLTDGATIAVDAALSNNFRVTLAGNRTLANPTNLTDGMVLNFKIKQDGTGGRTLAYGSKYKWSGGTAPVLSTAAAAVDFISAYYDGADDILICNLVKDAR